MASSRAVVVVMATLTVALVLAVAAMAKAAAERAVTMVADEADEAVADEAAAMVKAVEAFAEVARGTVTRPEAEGLAMVMAGRREELRTPRAHLWPGSAPSQLAGSA